MKKSFLVYNDWYEVLHELSNEELGGLWRRMFQLERGQDITPMNDKLKGIFDFIRLQLDRDKMKWDITIANRSKAGKISAESRANKRTRTKSTHVNTINTCQHNEHMSTHSTVIDIVNVIVNVNVRDKIHKFIAFRTAIKKPMTDHAVELFIAKLNRYAKDPDTQVAIMDQSILAGWSDIYPLNGIPKTPVTDKSAMAGRYHHE